MNKSFKIVLFTVLALLIVSLSFFSFLNMDSVKDSILGMNGEAFVALNKEARAARIKNPLKHSYAYFKFTKNQQLELKNLVRKNNGESVEVTLEFLEDYKKSKDTNFALGFLYEKDFKKENKLYPSIESRPLVYGELPISEDYKNITLSFAVLPEEECPLGFFIYSKTKLLVKSVHFIEPKLGWSRNEESAAFCFSSNGGKADFSFSVADFTEGKNLFFDETLIKNNVFPKILLGFSDIEDIGTFASQVKVTLNYADEELYIRRAPHKVSTVLQTSAFQEPFSLVSLVENAQMVTSVFMTQNEKKLLPEENKILTPLITDVGLVFKWNTDFWRCKDYELYEWENFPGVLLFDFVDYEKQNLFFTRLAYFVEKAGYKGTFVTDEFIKKAHGYNAHDYKAEDLARFFSLAEQQNVILNNEEKLLKEILLKNGIIIENKSSRGYEAGVGAVISISRESKDYQRYTLLAHECWHGIYFVDEDFRNVSYVAYSLFDPVSMDFLKTYWEKQPTLNYDRKDEYLMRNEFMAYILQNPISKTQEYWVSHAKWNSVQRDEKTLADYVIENNALSFREASEFLSTYVFDHWGLAAGRVFLIGR